MIYIIQFLIIIPIVLVYTSAFIDFLIDRNTDIGDWFRNPTKMLNFMFTLILSCLSITYGVVLLAHKFNIDLK
jgi:hypothetical protein